MKTLFRLMLIVVACSIASVAQSRPVFLTKDNYQQFHAQHNLRPGWNLDTSTALNPTTSAAAVSLQDKVQIGVFYAIMWPSGQTMYEFDWVNPVGPCPPGCKYYGSNSISFKNIMVNVNGTDSSSGPMDEEFLGVAWFVDPGDTFLSNCQPLTQTSAGATFITYEASCIDVALQLVFPSKPYTFTLLNGSTFTTRGVSTSFIVPALGKTGLYSYCEASDTNFCNGQRIPIYVQRVPTPVT